MIDLAWCSLIATKIIIDMQVLQCMTSSDHFPIMIELNMNHSAIESISLPSERLVWKQNESVNFVNSMYYSNNIPKVNLNNDEMNGNIIGTIKNRA